MVAKEFLGPLQPDLIVDQRRNVKFDFILSPIGKEYL